MKQRVDFLVAGAQKSGTKAFRHLLSQNPSIGVSDSVEETHFFSKRYLDVPHGDYAAYHALFSQDALEKLTCDVTPIYIFQKGCLERARAYNPDLKVIVLLRDPVARAYSQWKMEHRKGNETRGFVAALLNELWYVIKAEQHPVYSYVQRGFYTAQIKRLFEIFPRENCLIIKHDTLEHDYLSVLQRVWAFLGAETDVPIQNKRVHTQTYTPLSGPLRVALKLLFRRDINRLEALLDWDCSDWKKL